MIGDSGVDALVEARDRRVLRLRFLLTNVVDTALAESLVSAGVWVAVDVAAPEIAMHRVRVSSR